MNETSQCDSVITGVVPNRPIILKDTVWHPNEDNYELNLKDHTGPRLTKFYSELVVLKCGKFILITPIS